MSAGSPAARADSLPRLQNVDGRPHLHRVPACSLQWPTQLGPSGFPAGSTWTLTVVWALAPSWERYVSTLLMWLVYLCVAGWGGGGGPTVLDWHVPRGPTAALRQLWWVEGCISGHLCTGPDRCLSGRPSCGRACALCCLVCCFLLSLDDVHCLLAVFSPPLSSRVGIVFTVSII